MHQSFLRIIAWKKRDNGMFQSTWHCYMYYNTAQTGEWASKSIFITYDENEGLSAGNDLT
jgi:hypothetical protein